MKLNSKFREQQKELNRLVRISSYEVSSASEAAVSVSPMDVPRMLSREGSCLSTTPAPMDLPRALSREGSFQSITPVREVKKDKTPVS